MKFSTIFIVSTLIFLGGWSSNLLAQAKPAPLSAPEQEALEGFEENSAVANSEAEALEGFEENSAVANSEAEALEGFENVDLKQTSEFSEEGALEGFEDKALGGFEEEALDGFETSTEGEFGKKEASKGFGNTPSSSDQPSGTETTSKPLDWLRTTGKISLGTSYNTSHSAPEFTEDPDFRGFSRAQVQGNLELNMELHPAWNLVMTFKGAQDSIFILKRRDDYHPEYLKSQETQAEMGDTYLLGTITPQLDIRIGRQVNVWGSADNVRVVDVLNPTDSRTPGIVDLEDIRLPVTMTRLDYYHGDHHLQLNAVHEIRFSKRPAQGSDYYPSDEAQPREIRPSDGGSNTEYGLMHRVRMSGWDFSLHWAQYYDDDFHYHVKETMLMGNVAIPQKIVRRHSRLTLTGGTVSIATGNWLIKSEAAQIQGLEFFASAETFQRVDLMVGLEYTGFDDITLNMETAQRHLQDFDRQLQASPDNAREHAVQTVFSYSHDLLHDRLQVALLGTALGHTGEEGAFQRASLDYELAAGLNLKGGYINYDGGNNFFWEFIKDNDRVFVDLEYSF